ncbi:MAG: hypothetical protein RR515_00075 [Clostridium sp.]
MKKFIIIIITGFILIGFTGCNDSVADNAIKDGKTFFAKALAIKEGSDNRDVIKIHGILVKYIKAKGEFDKKKLVETRKTISGIDPDYINYPIKSYIDDLKNSIEDEENIVKDEKESKDKVRKEVENQEKENTKSFSQGGSFKNQLKDIKSEVENLKDKYENPIINTKKSGSEDKKSLKDIFSELKEESQSDEVEK